MLGTEYVLFDLDGTLTDPREGICKCYAHALESVGVQPPPLADLEQYIGPPLRLVFPILLKSEESQLVEKAVTYFRERFSSVGLFENKLMYYARELLVYCKEAHLNTFIVTAKPTVFAERVLRYFEISEYLDGVYGTELDGTFDNKKDLIAHVLLRENISASCALMIGDRKEDVVAAIANQVRPIGVTCGFGSYEELSTAGAQMIFPDLFELKQWIAEK